MLYDDPTRYFPTDNGRRVYLCIDLKSFFASVECVARGLDPMTTNLVVADPDRSTGTICLAITPAMKKLGIKNRCRVYEIPKEVDYIIAPPRMQHYIDCAADIYEIYLNYISKDDIHVYSIDEAFLDVTHYLLLYQKTPKELGQQIMEHIFQKTGVRATCGIGTNMYLAKIALDILAKHAEDFIGILDEDIYRARLWEHRPLTDFWRIGSRTAAKLERHGIFTMQQIARADEELLYKMFGIDAELLIDHAWGREPTTIADVKNYRSKSTSISSGQVLMRDYSFEEAALIVREMMDLVCLDMVRQEVITDSVTIHVCYSHLIAAMPAHGTATIPNASSAFSVWLPEIMKLYHRIVADDLPIRRICITCNRIAFAESADLYQTNLFGDAPEQEELEQAHKLQQTVLDIKDKFGKNAILKGMNYQQASTTRERNMQIGGHKSGT